MKGDKRVRVCIWFECWAFIVGCNNIFCLQLKPFEILDKCNKNRCNLVLEMQWTNKAFAIDGCRLCPICICAGFMSIHKAFISHHQTRYKLQTNLLHYLKLKQYNAALQISVTYNNPILICWGIIHYQFWDISSQCQRDFASLRRYGSSATALVYEMETLSE